MLGVVKDVSNYRISRNGNRLIINPSFVDKVHVSHPHPVFSGIGILIEFVLQDSR